MLIIERLQKANDQGMNMRDLTAEEKATFERAGVVHVKGAVDADTVQAMMAAVERLISSPIPGMENAPRGTGMDRHLFPDHPDFNELLYQTDLAKLAAQATGSETIRAYFEQIFIKAANSPGVFSWHQDHPYWPIGGSQVVSTWVALTPATVEGSALEFVKGSNKWGKTYQPVAGETTDRDLMNTLWDGFGDLAVSYPDVIIPFEDHPDRFDVVGFAVEPGDALLFDYRILHRSRGNASNTRRVAVSWRWLGDDATWEWVRGADPIVSSDHHTVAQGAKIDDDAVFPVVYSVSSSPAPPIHA